MNVAGFNVNHFDIAPRYASILMGLSNGFGALAGLSGFITQHLTVNNPAGWKYCFLLAMSVDIFGIIFFLLFAKGEVQDWAREPEPEETLGEFQLWSVICRQGDDQSVHVVRALRSTSASMEEERNNSSEMEPRKVSEGEPRKVSEGAEVTLPEEKVHDPRKTTDRPEV
ncbi:hypothetical protein COOONC_10515 [Cooperia oncophora]